MTDTKALIAEARERVAEIDARFPVGSYTSETRDADLLRRLASALEEANKTITALLKVRDAAIVVIDAHLLEVEDPWGLLDEAIVATL